MTALREHLLRRIRATGPLTLADYMAACLSDPDHGYYATRDPLGARGDFVTAPEISQMFGELLGLSLAQHWQDGGAPSQIVLCELGPGRGTLMADALRATGAVPGFADAARLHLVETSPVLRAEQARILPDATWHDRLDDVPDGPLYLVANEFFDALPVRQARREPDGWSERMIGETSGALAWGWSPSAPISALDHRLADTKPGDIVEWNAPALAVASEIARRVARFGGAALIVDYGDWVSQGDTFQALRGHGYADPLDAPGDADMTAHVDFAALADAAATEGAAHSRLTPQGVFLERLGITQRATTLARGLGGTALDAHVAAHRRLTHPAEMGHLFKVMSIHSPAAPPPPGLEP